MDNNYILTLKNITKEFPGVKALDDVTINIERGTIHGLVGENGAGIIFSFQHLLLWRRINYIKLRKSRIRLLHTAAFSPMLSGVWSV